VSAIFERLNLKKDGSDLPLDDAPETAGDCRLAHVYFYPEYLDDRVITVELPLKLLDCVPRGHFVTTKVVSRMS